MLNIHVYSEFDPDIYPDAFSLTRDINRCRGRFLYNISPYGATHVLEPPLTWVNVVCSWNLSSLGATGDVCLLSPAHGESPLFLILSAYRV